MLCCSPENESRRPQLGHATAGEAQVQARRPSTSHTAGQRSNKEAAASAARLWGICVDAYRAVSVWQEAAGRNQMSAGMDHDRSGQVLVPSVDARIRAPNHETALNG